MMDSSGFFPSSPPGSPIATGRILTLLLVPSQAAFPSERVTKAPKGRWMIARPCSNRAATGRERRENVWIGTVYCRSLPVAALLENASCKVNAGKLGHSIMLFLQFMPNRNFRKSEMRRIWAALLISFSVTGGFLLARVTMPFTPPAEEAAGQPFSFLVYGDIQDNYRSGHDALVKQMLQEPAELIFNTGDISPHEGKHYVRDFYPVIEKLAEKVPFFPAIGNHDIDWGSATSRQRFHSFFHRIYEYLAREPGNEHLRDPESQKLWYSLLYRNVLFIVLDSNFFIDEGKYANTHELETYRDHLEEQLIWVRNLLRESSENPAIRARFVFFHHSPFFSDENDPFPIFGFGGHPGHRRMIVNLRVPSEEFSEPVFLLDLFRKYGVNAVFTGHEHYYERWQEIIREDRRPIRVLNWVVTGLGGVKPRGRPKYKDESIQDVLEEKVYREYLNRIADVDPQWASKLLHIYPTEASPAARFHHYVRVTLEDSGIHFQAKDISGDVRDQGYFDVPRPHRFESVAKEDGPL